MSENGVLVGKFWLGKNVLVIRLFSKGRNTIQFLINFNKIHIVDSQLSNVIGTETLSDTGKLECSCNNKNNSFKTKIFILCIWPAKLTLDALESTIWSIQIY